MRLRAWLCALAGSAAYTTRGPDDRHTPAATVLVAPKAPDVYDDINDVFEDNPDGWAVKDNSDVSPTRRQESEHDKQKTAPALPECHRCGTGKKGEANCCSAGGAWAGSCTASLTDGGAHTFVEGFEACNHSPQQQQEARTQEAQVVQSHGEPDWGAHSGRGAGGLEDSESAAIPLRAGVRKCDSEREEWCDCAPFLLAAMALT